ncbi:arsenate reductase-like glutaredoxin family protein [Streptococcus pneumoniae]|nr:arsenate reductase-like glutaredoxin family protein [Streptococcus pneumoniae]
MIDLYLSKNRQRNQLLLDFFQNYGIEVSCHSVSEMTKDKLIEMMSYSSDCFEFLSPNLLRFKNRDNLRLTDFVEIILKNPELTIGLPFVVSNKRVYPSLNLEEARALLPRDTKQLIYMAGKCVRTGRKQLLKLSSLYAYSELFSALYSRIRKVNLNLPVPYEPPRRKASLMMH